MSLEELNENVAVIKKKALTLNELSGQIAQGVSENILEAHDNFNKVDRGILILLRVFDFHVATIQQQELPEKLDSNDPNYKQNLAKLAVNKPRRIKLAKETETVIKQIVQLRDKMEELLEQREDIETNRHFSIIGSDSEHKFLLEQSEAQKPQQPISEEERSFLSSRINKLNKLVTKAITLVVKLDEFENVLELNYNSPDEEVHDLRDMVEQANPAFNSASLQVSALLLSNIGFDNITPQFKLKKPDQLSGVSTSVLINQSSIQENTKKPVQLSGVTTSVPLNQSNSRENAEKPVQLSGTTSLPINQSNSRENAKKPVQLSGVTTTIPINQSNISENTKKTVQLSEVSSSVPLNQSNSRDRENTENPVQLSGLSTSVPKNQLKRRENTNNHPPPEGQVTNPISFTSMRKKKTDLTTETDFPRTVPEHFYVFGQVLTGEMSFKDSPNHTIILGAVMLLGMVMGIRLLNSGKPQNRIPNIADMSIVDLNSLL